MLIIVVAAAIATVVLVLPGPSGETRPATTPAPAASQQVIDEDEEDGERVAPGTAWSLQLDGETRESLVDAAREAGTPAALTVAASGTVYYGAVYGQTEADDVFYAIAIVDRIHFWSKHGGNAWRYGGDFETAGCIAPVPLRLYTAWGLSLSTERPAGQPPCPNRQ
ncbi:hypothetical protein [Nonomuraea sp. NEAU-A123]|uniref:hypothetical protein n=1 Tax=Nonomuraea sp. NEAU-A123 TaxID=2839649 RepID=UPI001BE3EC2B|nr:hypothetical protein [Nonomuraea sp. NEAU-A123]MBT2232268.1 hypothetical protein [Nonomuraea sp. NEAU-A123]